MSSFQKFGGGYGAARAKAEAQSNEPQQQPASRNCAAYGCPMPGSIDGGGGCVCAHHYGASPHQWPAVTEAMNRDHGPLLSEILTARRFHGQLPQKDPTTRMHEAWARLRPHGYDLDPANCVHAKGGARRLCLDYRHWAGLCESMLGSLIRERAKVTRPALQYQAPTQRSTAAYDAFSNGFGGYENV